MMLLALIPPYARLADMDKTNYQLCLAHIMATPSYEGVRYAGAFLDAKERGDFIILDNGAYEGSVVMGDQLITVANSLLPNELVIPDALRNEKVTKEMAIIFQSLHAPKLNPSIQLMFVVQGVNYYEMSRSVEWATRQDWIDTIGIPKHTLVTANDLHARIRFADFIFNNSNKNIHLLGASPMWTDEFIAVARQGYARGMDTSLPYVYGMHELSLPSRLQMERFNDHFTHRLDIMQNHLIDNNLKYMLGKI